MKKLTKPRSSKYSIEKFKFTFSSFQVSKVPLGIEKLVISLVSLESGKTIARTSKALVRSGCCHWQEAILESVKFLHDDFTKDLEERLFKFVVSVGSAKASILGEATVNLVNYLSSTSLISVPLPLENGNQGVQGALLKVKIQCLNPRVGYREPESWKDILSEHEDQYSSSDDVDMRSEGSDQYNVGSVGSTSGTSMGTGFYQSKDGSSSPANSHGSDVSSPILRGNGHFRSHLTQFDNTSSSVKRQEDSATTKTKSSLDPLKSNPSKGTGTTIGHLVRHWQDRSSREFNRNVPNTNRSVHPGSSEKWVDQPKGISDATDIPTHDLQREAMTWERNARKLRGDVEILRNQLTELTKEHSDLKIEFSATAAERDSLKVEVEQLNAVLQASMERENFLNKTRSEAVDAKRSIRELQEELELQQQSNTNLGMQLMKAQESNAELLSVLHEVEENANLKRNELGKLMEELREQTNSNKMLKAELRKAQGSHSQLVSNIKELENKVKEQQREIDHLSNIELNLKLKLEASQEECRSKKNQIDELRWKSENLQKLVEESDSKLYGALKDLESSKTKARVLQSRMDRMLKEISESTKNEHGSKVEELTIQLSTSKLKEEEMNASLENALRHLEDMKKIAESFKAKINSMDKEIRLLNEENEKLKQSLVTSASNERDLNDLRHDMDILNSEYNNLKREKSILESSMQSKDSELSGILSDKLILFEELESIEAAFLEGDQIKCSKAMLEEKILCLQGKLTMKNIHANNDNEQKNEMEGLKRFHEQFQSKLRCLEEDREAFKRKIRVLEKDIETKTMKLSMVKQESLLSSKDSTEKPNPLHMKTVNQLLQKEVENIKKVNKRLQIQLIKYQENSESGDLLGKLVKMEVQLAEAIEANAMYKSQLQSFMSQDQSVMLAALQGHGTVEQVLNELMNYKHIVPSLEADLKDLRRRYFCMSLQYAEVEAQRDELVMTVKHLKNGRKWF